MTVDPKILTAASDLMSRLESSGALSLPGLDIKKAGDKYVIKDIEFPRLAVEATLLDILGAETSLLDAAACKQLHTDERLAFLGLEGQPAEILALFVRRAENLSAKLASLSGYERRDYSPSKGSYENIGYEWDKKIVVPLQIDGLVTRGIIFTKKVKWRAAYKAEVRICAKYEYRPSEDAIRAVSKNRKYGLVPPPGARTTFNPRVLAPGDPWLVNPVFTQSFRMPYRVYENCDLVRGVVNSPERILVYHRDYPNHIDYADSYYKITEHDFLRILARDAIARGGDTSELPELFESINLKTVAEKFK